MEQNQRHHLEPPPRPRRRTLINRLWALLALVAFVELGWLSSSLFKSRRKRDAHRDTIRYVDAGRVETFKPGEVKAIPEALLFLACLEDNRFIALSRTCTHLGCALSWDDRQKKFVCPCHGSTFDRTGMVVTSPALRPLDFYPVRIEDGLLRIEVANPQRRQSFDVSQTTQV